MFITIISNSINLKIVTPQLSTTSVEDTIFTISNENANQDNHIHYVIN